MLRRVSTRDFSLDCFFLFKHSVTFRLSPLLPNVLPSITLGIPKELTYIPLYSTLPPTFRAVADVPFIFGFLS